MFPTADKYRSSSPDLQKGATWPGVVCAGVYSSGSTWAFNVTVGLLQLSLGTGVTALYADDIQEPELRKIEQSGLFVLKTHNPAPSLRALCRIGKLPVVLTVRDPRDATVSLMHRFGHDLTTALERVERSANLALHLCERTSPLVLRYEDGFVDVSGISSISVYLGLALSASDKQRLSHRLSRNVVAQEILDFKNRGIFGGGDPAEEREARTQWHPNHVGDGRIGKYRDVLTISEIDKIAYATRPFCIAFKYDTSPIYAPATLATKDSAEKLMEGWIDHFVPPDLVSGWARLIGSDDRVEVRAQHEGRVIAHTLANLYRPDLAATGDGHVGFQLQLAEPVALDELICSVEIYASSNNAELGRIEPTPELAARARIGYRSVLEPAANAC